MYVYPFEYSHFLQQTYTLIMERKLKLKIDISGRSVPAGMESENGIFKKLKINCVVNREFQVQPAGSFLTVLMGIKLFYL